MAFTGWPFSDDQTRLSDDFWRMFSPFLFSRPTPRGAGVFPPLNFYDDGEVLMVRAEIPGINKDLLEVTVQDDQLTVRGDRQIETPSPGANYHRRERESGKFRRVVTLPVSVDSAKIQATYKNGILEVILPKAAEAKPRRIPIH